MRHWGTGSEGVERSAGVDELRDWEVPISMESAKDMSVRGCAWAKSARRAGGSAGCGLFATSNGASSSVSPVTSTKLAPSKSASPNCASP